MWRSAVSKEITGKYNSKSVHLICHVLADIHDVEKEWKEQFAEWNTYIVHWKHEYQNYMQTEYEQTKCDQQLNVQKRETGEL